MLREFSKWPINSVTPADAIYNDPAATKASRVFDLRSKTSLSQPLA